VTLQGLRVSSLMVMRTVLDCFTILQSQSAGVLSLMSLTPVSFMKHKITLWMLCICHWAKCPGRFRYPWGWY